MGFCLSGLYIKQKVPKNDKWELKDHTEKGIELFDTFAGTSWVLFGGKWWDEAECEQLDKGKAKNKTENR